MREGVPGTGGHSCCSWWGRARAGRRIPVPDAAPGASERSEGEDTTALFPTLYCGGAVPGRDANNVSNFDGYRIAGYSAWGGSASGSGHGGTTMRSDAKPGDFDSVWRDDDRSRIIAEGSAVWGIQEGDIRGPRKEPRKLVERTHEGSSGSASSSVKDPRETDLGSEGDLRYIKKCGDGGREPGKS